LHAWPESISPSAQVLYGPNRFCSLHVSHVAAMLRPDSVLSHLAMFWQGSRTVLEPFQNRSDPF
jgi:hypothetical protein